MRLCMCVSVCVCAIVTLNLIILSKATFQLTVLAKLHSTNMAKMATNNAALKRRWQWVKRVEERPCGSGTNKYYNVQLVGAHRTYCSASIDQQTHTQRHTRYPYGNPICEENNN